jgi:hypothetical protein
MYSGERLQWPPTGLHCARNHLSSMCPASFCLDWTYPFKGSSELGLRKSDSLYRTWTLKMGSGRNPLRIWDFRTRFTTSSEICELQAIECSTSGGKFSIVAKCQDLARVSIQCVADEGCALALPKPDAPRVFWNKNVWILRKRRPNLKGSGLKPPISLLSCCSSVLQNLGARWKAYSQTAPPARRCILTTENNT